MKIRLRVLPSANPLPCFGLAVLLWCHIVTANKLEPKKVIIGPYSFTSHNQTPILEWCVVRGGSKNRHQKDIMCLKENGLGA